MLLIGFLSLGLICWLICRQLASPASRPEPGLLSGRCPACRAEVENGGLLCPDCQTPLRQCCQQCGEIHDCWFNFCPWCGLGAATEGRNE